MKQPTCLSSQAGALRKNLSLLRASKTVGFPVPFETFPCDVTSIVGAPGMFFTTHPFLSGRLRGLALRWFSGLQLCFLKPLYFLPKGAPGL